MGTSIIKACGLLIKQFHNNKGALQSSVSENSSLGVIKLQLITQPIAMHLHKNIAYIPSLPISKPRLQGLK